MRAPSPPEHKRLWPDQGTGLWCFRRVAPLGFLCGYVAVPPTHPWDGLHYWAPGPNAVEVFRIG